MTADRLNHLPFNKGWVGPGSFGRTTAFVTVTSQGTDAIFVYYIVGSVKQDLVPRAMDPILLVIGILLIATAVAFLTGLIPYPFGWIVLSVVFILRLVHLRRKVRGRGNGFQA